MKLFLFCTLAAVLGLVRSLDVTCTPHFSDNTTCAITEPVTIKAGEKVNIISDNNLNSIKEVTFGTKADNRSQISAVPSEIFEQLPNLEILALYGSVNVLNGGDFEKAGKLKHFIIENQLKIIPAGILTLAKTLERLILSDNQIAEIEDNAFNGLNALLKLDLDSNELTIIKQNTFNGLEKLETLNLADNQIESIEENALSLPNLINLHVRDNKLTSLSDNLFAATPLLEALHANTNQINHIGKSLYGLKNLKYLYLSYNKPTDVDLVAFSQLPMLEILDLDEIGLTSENINRIEISEPSNSVLVALSLRGNQLSNNDDWKRLAIFPQLMSIDVRNTKYSKIDLGDKTLRQQFPQLTAVYISSGEWSCEWLKNFIKSSMADGLDIRTTIGSSDLNSKDLLLHIGCV